MGALSYNHERLRTTLAAAADAVVELAGEEKLAIQQQWRSVFARKLYEAKGVWVFSGFDWHVFSHHFTAAKEGAKAEQLYGAAKGGVLYVIPEDEEMPGFRCEGAQRPELGALGLDLHVFPPTLEWTMAFTHEDECGPYFSRSEWA